MTTVSIACDVSQPDGTEFLTARLEFALSGTDYDTAAGEAIPAVTTYVDLDASGVGTAALWPVDLGTRNTFYAVVLRGSVTRDGRTSEVVSTLGRIQPQSSGGQTLADLLAQSSGGIVVGSAIYETLADAVAAALEAAAAGADPVAALAAAEAAQAAEAGAETAQGLAEAAASIAQTRTDIVVQTFAGLAALTYADAGLTAGKKVTVPGIGVFTVLASDASGADLDYTGAGGVKLARVITGEVSILQFSDLVDGDDWRPAIQGALDWMAGRPTARKLSIPIRVGVSLNPSAPSHTNAYGAGAVAISVKRSNITIGGGGCVYLLEGQGSGKEGAIFGNPDVVALSDVTFDDVEIDGNANNTLGLISGILMVGCTRPTVTDKTYVHDVTRHGIMFRANSSQSGFGPVDVKIGAAAVENCGGIGAQATRPDGCIIDGTRIKNCVDNGWDVYGNDPADANGSFARGVDVRNVQVTECLTGGFPESFSDAAITGTYRGCNGIKMNRIISGAKRMSVRAKFTCEGFANEGRAYGIQIANNSGFAFLDGNEFEGLKQAVLSGSGCDRVRLTGNQLFRDLRNYVWQHGYAANSLIRCVIDDQWLEATGISASGWPQMAPPSDHPWYAGSRFQSTVGKLYLMANKTEVLPDFTKSIHSLTTPGAWGGAYSLYNIGSDGKTRVNTTPDIDVTLRPIVVIAGQTYELSPSGTSGEYWIAQWDGVSATHGNYTAALNSALEVKLKYEGYKSPLHSDTSYAETRALVSVAGWGPAYSTYSGGDTLVSLAGAAIDAGTVAVINGYSYALTATATAEQYTAKRLNKVTGTSGDWTAYLAAAHTAYIQ